MVSEDSDHLVPGLSPVHRLGDFGDLNETIDVQMTTSGDELNACTARICRSSAASQFASDAAGRTV